MSAVAAGPRALGVIDDPTCGEPPQRRGAKHAEYGRFGSAFGFAEPERRH
jgi:hypothetical protein